jgi:hypothetical protein
MEYPHYYGMKYRLYMVIYTHWIPLANQCRKIMPAGPQATTLWTHPVEGLDPSLQRFEKKHSGNWSGA